MPWLMLAVAGLLLAAAVTVPPAAAADLRGIAAPTVALQHDGAPKESVKGPGSARAASWLRLSRLDPPALDRLASFADDSPLLQNPIQPAAEAGAGAVQWIGLDGFLRGPPASGRASHPGASPALL